MGTTTIRVDTATHARLVEMSELSGSSLIETVREATEALQGLRFARQVASELGELRKDAAAWGSYLAEADSSSVADGVT